MEVQLDRNSTSFQFNQNEDTVIMLIRLADLFSGINCEGADRIRYPYDYLGKRTRFLNKDLVLALAETRGSVDLEPNVQHDLSFRKAFFSYLEAWYSQQITQAESEPWKVYFYLKASQLTEKIIDDVESSKILKTMQEILPNTLNESDHQIWKNLSHNLPTEGYFFENLIQTLEAECKKLRPDVLPFKSDLLDPA